MLQMKEKLVCENPRLREGLARDDKDSTASTARKSGKKVQLEGSNETVEDGKRRGAFHPSFYIRDMLDFQSTGPHGSKKRTMQTVAETCKRHGRLKDVERSLATYSKLTRSAVLGTKAVNIQEQCRRSRDNEIELTTKITSYIGRASPCRSSALHHTITHPVATWS